MRISIADTGVVAWSILTSAVFLLWATALFGWIRRRGSLDLAIIATPVFSASTLVLTVEALSSINAVNRAALTASLCLGTLLTLWTWQRWSPGLRVVVLDIVRAYRGLRQAVVSESPGGGWLSVSFAASVVVVMLGMVTAVLSPPNNPDVLAYHLPRAMWWLQGGQVGTYVASDPRQVAFPPLNSYLLLWLIGATGTDLFVNLIQWWAALVATLAAVLIGRRAGLNTKALVLVGIFGVTIPTGITVATTAKADWLAALWPVLALAAVLSRSRGRISFLSMVLLLAMTAALAAGTKATAAVGVGLVVALALWWEIRPVAGSPNVANRPRVRSRHAVIVASAGVTGVAVGFIPQALRTRDVYGTLTGPDLDIIVTEPSLGILWGNTVRTVLNNLGVPPPMSDWVNEQLPKVLPYIGVPLRDDAALHNDATLELLIGRNEDFATNPIHLILGLTAALIAMLWKRSPARLRYVSALVIVTFLASVGLVQWNLWTSRFLLTVMVLAAIPLGWLLAEALSRGSRRPSFASFLAVGVVVLSAVYGVLIAAYQEYRPLVGPGSILTTSRTDQYFAVNDRPGTPGNMQELVLGQVEALRSLPPGSRIGMVGVGPQEYLFWRFLNPDGRYTFVNLAGPDGPANVNLGDLDGVICIENCPMS